jgi:hypothetical protein
MGVELKAQVKKFVLYALSAKRCTIFLVTSTCSLRRGGGYSLPQSLTLFDEKLIHDKGTICGEIEDDSRCDHSG